MKAELSSHKLKVGGNKPDLLARYRAWYDAQAGPTASASSAGPSTGAGPSTASAEAPEDEEAMEVLSTADETHAAVIETLLDPSNKVATVPMLSRLIAPTKLHVSAVTLACVEKLRYTPGENFRTKPRGKDLSDTLLPIQRFVDVLLREMKHVRLTSEAGENESALRSYVKQTLPRIEAPVELAQFFAAWDISIKTNNSPSPPAYDTEYDAQMEMALHASRATALAESQQRDMDDNEREEQLHEAEEHRKALLQELDVVNNAIQHRLVRWSTTLPHRALADQLWPSTYSTVEKKAIRNYVTEYLTEHDLLEGEVDEQDKLNAIKEMQNDDAFPVELARSAAIIQAVFLESRFGEARRSRSQSEVTATPSVATSRSMSPVKRGRRGSSATRGRGGRKAVSAVSGRSGRKSGRAAGAGADLLEDDDMEAEDTDEDAREEEEQEVVISRGTKRPRRASTRANYIVDDGVDVDGPAPTTAEDDEEEDSDTYRDYQKQDRKRARKRTSKVKQLALQMDDEDQDEDADMRL
ncbi:hypothetical protein AA0112_g2300 [Alternaria arborescens]|nr:hypothetical protein AA0112_g2300 [Alternaria arborescens]